MSRISPASQASKSSLSSCRTFTLVGRSRPADKTGMTEAERILLVDDHPLTRPALAGLLTQQGFDVAREAEDGGQALDRAAELAPDLIFLELSMPGIDG